MSTRSRKSSLGTLMCAVAALALMVPPEAPAQTSGPSPYRLVNDWAQLPDGRRMGSVGPRLDSVQERRTRNQHSAV